MGSAERREAKLPKWVQGLLQELRREIRELQALREASAVLHDREWFTIGNPSERVRHLWYLHEDGAHAACTIGPGDVLLIGRARRDTNG